jgi:hypothetical protein
MLAGFHVNFELKFPASSVSFPTHLSRCFQYFGSPLVVFLPGRTVSILYSLWSGILYPQVTIPAPIILCFCLLFTVVTFYPSLSILPRAITYFLTSNIRSSFLTTPIAGSTLVNPQRNVKVENAYGHPIAAVGWATRLEWHSVVWCSRL